MKLEDYAKYYIQGSDHYLIPKDDFIELFNEMVNWRKETIELKKQVEERNIEYFKGVYDTNNKYDTQQKVFIKYLEGEIKIYSNTYMGEMLKEIEEILQKYKEIIGVSDEKEN